MPTYYLLDPLATATTTWGLNQETPPVAADSFTGFGTADGNGRVASGYSANMKLRVVTTRGFYTLDSSFPKPAGLLPADVNKNAWRFGPFTGLAPATTWNLGMSYRRTSPNVVGAHHQFLGKLYKSPDPNGVNNVTEIGDVESENKTGVLNTETSFLMPWVAPEIEFNNEYIFYALALRVNIMEGSSVGRYMSLRIGSNLYMQMPSLQPLGINLVGWIGM